LIIATLTPVRPIPDPAGRLRAGLADLYRFCRTDAMREPRPPPEIVQKSFSRGWYGRVTH